MEILNTRTCLINLGATSSGLGHTHSAGDRYPVPTWQNPLRLTPLQVFSGCLTTKLSSSIGHARQSRILRCDLRSHVIQQAGILIIQRNHVRPTQFLRPHYCQTLFPSFVKFSWIVVKYRTDTSQSHMYPFAVSIHPTCFPLWSARYPPMTRLRSSLTLRSQLHLDHTRHKRRRCWLC